MPLSTRGRKVGIAGSAILRFCFSWLEIKHPAGHDAVDRRGGSFYCRGSALTAGRSGSFRRLLWADAQLVFRFWATWNESIELHTIGVRRGRFDLCSITKGMAKSDA